MKIATAMQMNAVDDALIHQYGYSIYELVEMASQHLLEEMPKRKSYLLLAGPGNNGADALSLAKRLIEDGKEVYVQLFYFEHANSTVQHFYELIKDQVIFVERWVDTEVVVDGIFGNGLSRALDKDLQRYLQQINQLDGIHIAIDSPTGINATTGAMQSVCFQAEKTVTFMCYKLAMMNQDLRKWFGTITVKTFGIEQEVLEHSLIADAIDQNVISSFFKRRKNHDHKGVNGKITHFTGSREYTGAACLASLASVYSGSGIVRVCSDDYVLQQVKIHNLEAITLDKSIFSAKMLEGQQALLCGCGCGWMDSTRQMIRCLIKESKVPLVIDADGINVISEHPEWLLEKQCPIILTPHLGEFARLCPEMDDLETAIQTFAERYDVIMVVKGPNTIVYGDHRFYRNTTGNPGMATAGMGDALAGMISSFCGQGYEPLLAAQLGVYLHGLCGDQLYLDHYTVLPHRLIEKIPEMMKRLSNEKDIDWDNKSL